MDFGKAIEIMKAKGRVARAGWNGKGMFLYLVGAGRYPPATPAARMLASEQEDGLVPYASYIAMKTVDGTVVPWLASQTDMLAEDWGELVRVEISEVFDQFDLQDDQADAQPIETTNEITFEEFLDRLMGAATVADHAAQPDPAYDVAPRKNAPEADECNCAICQMLETLNKLSPDGSDC